MCRVLFVCMLVFVASTAKADILGRWKTGDDGKGSYGIINFYKCGSKYCGRLVDAGGRKVDKSLFGIIIVKNMKKRGGNYTHGRIFAADSGQWYFSKMQHIGPNKLKVSGCVLGGIICKAQIWVRNNQ